MGRRKKQMVEAGLCANGLHPWGQGQRECMDCNRESQRRYREANTEKRRENDRRYYEANTEKVRERTRLWYEANPEKARERSRLWEKANPEKARENNRRWREANPEKARESTRLWYEANPEKNREKQRRRRARLENNGAYAVSDKDMRRLQQQPCAHEHLSPCNGPMHVDHVVPVARGGTHGIGNLQMLCQRHNQSKSAKLEVEIRRRATSGAA